VKFLGLVGRQSGEIQTTILPSFTDEARNASFPELRSQVSLDRRNQDSYASGLCSLPPENRNTAKTESLSRMRTRNTEADHLLSIEPDSATVLFCSVAERHLTRDPLQRTS